MTLFGVERWTERGEAFSVYFNLFARMSPLERRGRRLGLRRPLSGLTTLDTGSGTVAVVAVMLGMTTFDGASAGPLWSQDVAPPLLDAFRSLGLSPGDATEATWTLGLVGAVLAVHVFYRLGIAGVRSVDRTQDAERLARAFAHTLVPIALVYVGAHYLSFLVMQGQAVGYLVSDPLGHGWDLFGTAHRAIDWGVLGATTIWWLQVGLVIAGHVAGLALAHDRALVLFRTSRQASRSQLWMLAVMVGFTGLALSLLSQANA